jgi:GT2 family glycosyltransferase/glycosyltransferase involved in cell wall biosynthesis
MAPILLVSYAGVIGGAERVLLDFADGLDGERVLACPEGALAAAARERGVRVLPQPVHPLVLRGSWSIRARAATGLLAHGARVRGLVRALEPSLVVLSGMRSILAGLLIGPLDVPVIADHHDLVPGGWIGAALRRALRGASLIVVPSGVVANDLRLDDGPDARIIPPGLEPQRFPREAPAEPPLVLTLGAIVRFKRPGLAVAVVARARELAPELDLRLRLAGAPIDPTGEVLLARLPAAPWLTVSPVEDVPRALGEATLLLHCAEREPFGVALIEALAAGRPVVAPAAGGPLEIVTEQCGVLYPPGDIETAARAVVAVAGDPELAESLGSAGRARASERFDVRRTREAFAAAASAVARPAGVGRADRGAGLAIITVAYESAPELRELLDSIGRHLPAAEVVVADNASPDDSAAIAEAAGARVVSLESNLGFGTACNRALAEVRAPVCALLNPDVVLLDDSLVRLAEAAAGGDRLLAPLVLGSDGTAQDTVHPLPGSVAELARAVVPYTLLPVRSLAPWRSREPHPVGWAVGAALVGTTELLRRLGPFDEQIFMYGEDLDLALRAREAGVATWFDPRARVLHHGGRSAARAFGGEPIERRESARRAVVERRLGPGALRRDTGAAAVRYLTRISARRLLGRPAERERAQLRALWRP